MGAVFDAYDNRVGRPVAVKVLRPGIEVDEHVLARFRAEGTATASVNHPNVVVIHDVGVDGSTHYLVMELLQGQTLRHHISEQGRLSFADTAKLLLPVMNALALVHAKGIVHRDLKPENIFLADGADGATVVAKILDFGIAKLKTDATRQRTATGWIAGSVGYMAPEQMDGAARAEPRSDQFSLGVIIYECLAGKRPYGPFVEARGDYPFGAVAARASRKEYEPLQSLVPNIPDAVEALVSKMLEPTADKRYSDIDAVTKAVSDVLSELNHEGTIERRALPLAVAAPSTKPGQIVANIAKPSSGEILAPQSSWLTWWVMVGALAIAIAIGAYVGALSFPHALQRDRFPAGPVNPMAVTPISSTQSRATSPSAMRTATIQMRLEPPEAVITLDGQMVQNPLVLPVSERRYRLRVEADGYQAQASELRVQGDRTLSVTLRPLEDTRSTAKSVGRPRLAKTTAAPKAIPAERSITEFDDHREELQGMRPTANVGRP